LEWDNALTPGVTSVTLQSAVSFGSIPQNLAVAPFFVSIDPVAVSMIPGQSATFNVTVAHNPDTDFNSAIDLSLADPPPGITATLGVSPETPGTFKYQWYAGHAGFSSTPIAGANSSTFTTPAINSTSEFWVRISDACGTIDSQTATVTPFD